MTERARRVSAPDAVIAAAVDQAAQAARETAGDFGVGEHVGCVAEGERVATHYFTCPHPGYRGWQWAVVMARAPRARTATVNEVTLLPTSEALLAPPWVPWSNRVQPADLTPGTVLPTPDNDERLEPGYSGGELAGEPDPAEWSITRAVVAELGLGRERVLSVAGRQEAAERWFAGESGPDNASSRQAPANCVSCGYFVRLRGALGGLFGVCANRHSPYDARVVSVDHGCGGHSDVVADERGVEIPSPVYDTISLDDSIFD